jgi:hypothetical protein
MAAYLVKVMGTRYVSFAVVSERIKKSYIMSPVGLSENSLENLNDSHPILATAFLFAFFL